MDTVKDIPELRRFCDLPRNEVLADDDYFELKATLRVYPREYPKKKGPVNVFPAHTPIRNDGPVHDIRNEQLTHCNILLEYNELKREAGVEVPTDTGEAVKAKRGRTKGKVSLSRDERQCIDWYKAGMKPSEIDEKMMKKGNAVRAYGLEWSHGTAEKVIEAAKQRGEIPRKPR